MDVFCLNSKILYVTYITYSSFLRYSNNVTDTSKNMSSYTNIKKRYTYCISFFNIQQKNTNCQYI